MWICEDRYGCCNKDAGNARFTPLLSYLRTLTPVFGLFISNIWKNPSLLYFLSVCPFLRINLSSGDLVKLLFHPSQIPQLNIGGTTDLYTMVRGRASWQSFSNLKIILFQRYRMSGRVNHIIWLGFFGRLIKIIIIL